MAHLAIAGVDGTVRLWADNLPEDSQALRAGPGRHGVCRLSASGRQILAGIQAPSATSCREGACAPPTGARSEPDGPVTPPVLCYGLESARMLQREACSSPDRKVPP
ncbi:uncharacterized protein STAUR_5525 [Stigmatella aurantiaca DW4/3-1]|uniref:Uncharacterized protein n=1 Tax=Stigmatella aurantiaca (strain DW4/3-1) TaxID=378806 RepID=E3FR76_STIAD|nr:uncharacterized protein STAUR_5525 [Stigmatella aurantiaca DW4/3-1]